jgi:hypothetical protein
MFALLPLCVIEENNDSNDRARLQPEKKIAKICRMKSQGIT